MHINQGGGHSPHGEANPDRRVLWVGLGYERDTSRQLIETAIQAVCHAHHLAEEAIAGIATLDSKASDKRLIGLCHDRHWELRSFSPQDLRAVAVPNPSAIVEQLARTPSVSEAAAILAAVATRHEVMGENLPFLYIPKQVFRQDGQLGAVTVAIARSLTQSQS